MQSPTTRNPRQIVIMGASSGIGAALAAAIARAGDQIYACARRVDRLEQLQAQHANVHGIACDVSDEQEVRRAWAEISKHTQVIDVLINSAGGFGAIGPVDKTDSAAWLETLQVNLFGTYLTVKHGLPLLRLSADARVINLAGGGAFDAFPNYSAYACSKAGVVRLTECLAVELRDDAIMVNALAPGMVATEIHEATLAQGPELAGEQFQRTRAMVEAGGASMGTVIRCVERLLSPELRGLTGKTISANFDPWETPAFADNVDEITVSDLWSMRRVNLVNLPPGELREALENARDPQPDA